eukprot:CAMPEP_0168856586 /NCGR_PEP_ID=MMETSP0727-20121128/15265_1 /TAXON_ID=265536 /ORGANISM="Amphiprora sp., Strain CCMP467" /LENGTH=524 /DNA_ID=CAMNT_0008911137 /DNA_START=138 /DNA_END=1709 /DNA_ORIENTATION=-
MSEEELDIKQSDSVEKFTSPARKRKKAARKWDVDGIDVNHPNTYIARQSLVAKAIKSARQRRFLVVGSPPGTGKTALSQLILAQLVESNKADTGGKIPGYYIRPSEVTDDFNLFDYVANRTGVDLRHYNVSKDLEGSLEIWLIFDDAQRLFDRRHDVFWELVTKQKGQIEVEFGAIKIIVVVLATYHLSTTTGSPACFKAQNRLGYEDLLFRKEEAADVYHCRCMRPDWNEYFERLFYVTQGAAAAFTIGMNRIVHLSERADTRSAIQELTESVALYELIEKTPFSELERCFPSRKINEQSQRAILSAVVEAYQANMGDEEEDNDGAQADDEAIIMLIKAGILKESMQFSSHIAKRFYYNQVFPRAPRGSEVPETLDDLIVEATKKLSARRLRGARQEASGVMQSPKEAVYQQLFHEAFASLLPVSYRIIPELGTKAMIGDRTVIGELDFYIKNGNRWAVEFLCDGDRLDPHLDRIPGKYRNVEASSWLVVDCRMGGKPKKRDKDLCTLVFDEKFTSCEFYMRQ